MFLYSEGGRERLGNITPEQIETTALEALVRTNQAMVNSDIDLVLSLVYVGPVSSWLWNILVRICETPRQKKRDNCKVYQTQAGCINLARQEAKVL